MDNEPSYIRPRIANACDACKARKVKCDGKQPCSYCARRRQGCQYSPQKRRGGRVRHPRTPLAKTPLSRQHSGSGSGSVGTHDGTPVPQRRLDGQTISGQNTRKSTPLPPLDPTTDGPNREEDDTEVPREARLLRDAQGKLIFIGDCAPLSFFQIVRQLITTRVEPHAFSPDSTRFSVLEVAAPPQPPSRSPGNHPPPLQDVSSSVRHYLFITTAMLDLFHGSDLEAEVLAWSLKSEDYPGETTVVNYLILAIGQRGIDEAIAQSYFEYARDQALVSLSSSLSMATVQTFALVTLYLICSNQINAAFLFFGIAVRAGYSVGIHRTEVNARFGSSIKSQRDRLWTSLRVFDVYLAICMGRPPMTSDLDCTVSYKTDDGSATLDLLNANVQILLITEQVVLEIYSRRKISLQLTEGISAQLREWSSHWLQQLKSAIAETQHGAIATGACKVLSAYCYAVMLVSRPFLMYELIRNLDAPVMGSSSATGKSKLADACIDAATLVVDSVQELVRQDAWKGRMPLLVPWLFASSLVLGVGLLGGFGRILERQCRSSIEALDYFAKYDAHAEQYSLIAQSLLTVSLDYLERKELEERQKRTESSSQLFGLMPPSSNPSTPRPSDRRHLLGNTPMRSQQSVSEHGNDATAMHSDLPGIDLIDSTFLGPGGDLTETPNQYWSSDLGFDADQTSAMNLFTLLDSGGGIDLAHHL